MGSAVSRKAVSSLLVDFPFLSFQSFSSASSLSPAACFTRLLVFYFPHISFFSLLFCLSLLPPSISVSPSSSGHMAGLGVTVCCLDRVMAYRASGYITEDIQPCFLCVHYSLLLPSSPLHFPNLVISLSDVHTHGPESSAFLLGLGGVYIQAVHASADRMRFCGERQPPQWGREQIGV